MARKTKQEIDKEVMFNKIMPSLSKVAEVEDDEDEDEDDTPAVKKRKTAKTKTRTSAKSRDDDDDDEDDDSVSDTVTITASSIEELLGRIQKESQSYLSDNILSDAEKSVGRGFDYFL